MKRERRSSLVPRWAYFLVWIACNAFFRVYFRMRVRGRPRPFPRGPLLIAANHCSYLDPVLLATALPRRVFFLVTSNVYDLPLYRPWMRLFGAIPVQEGSINVEAMRRALDLLRRGEAVVIFPEGGISDDSRLKEGRIGVASLLLQSGAPVLTVGLIGTQRALPKNGGLPRPARLAVVCSDIVRPDELDARLVPREARRVLRDRVMAAIARALPEAMRPRPVEA